MSYDLMVFERTKVPETKKEFMEWYAQQTEWSEDHDYESPHVTSPALCDWFMEMKDTFPPMNGEYAPDFDIIDEKQEAYLTDYAIGKDMIYAAFAWSVADEAYSQMRHLAQKHDVGFFDVSGDNSILLSDGTVIK